MDQRWQHQHREEEYWVSDPYDQDDDRHQPQTHDGYKDIECGILMSGTCS